MRTLRVTTSILLAGALATTGAIFSPQAHADNAALGVDPEVSIADTTSLSTALRRGLNMTPEQFRQAGTQAAARSDAVVKLSQTAGVQRVKVQDGRMVVVGKGATAQAAAARMGATFTSAGLDPKVEDVKELAKLYQHYVGNQGLMSITEGADGFIIKVNEPSKRKNAPASVKPMKLVSGAASLAGAKPRMTPQEFAKLFTKVKVVSAPRPATPLRTKVYAGQGYETASGGVCSMGYPVWNASGTRYMMTAGHCIEGETGQANYVRSFGGEPALRGSGATRLGQYGVNDAARFGRADTSSFEGSYDFGLLRTTNWNTFQDLPYAFRWQVGGSVAITGTAAVAVGQPICRSGRRTGWSCGTISEVGWVAVSNGPRDTRYVWSILAKNAVAGPGDSGGPWLTGNKVVGIMSAAGTDSAGNAVITASPTFEMFRFLPGYQTMMFMPNPTPTTTAKRGYHYWTRSRTVGGWLYKQPGDTIAPNTYVEVHIDKVRRLVPVRADGLWTFRFYPGFKGTHTVTMRTVNGFNRSGLTSILVKDV